jgi:outer membrane protein insertion porin family
MTGRLWAQATTPSTGSATAVTGRQEQPAQTGSPVVPQASKEAKPAQEGMGSNGSDMGPVLPALKTNLSQWKGLTVDAIQYEGVDFAKSDRLVNELSQKSGEPLDPQKVQQTTRRLFATGRYLNIAVRGVRHGDTVTLIFSGVPRYYVGRVEIHGVKDDRLTSLLEYGSKLNPGTAFNESDVPAGTEALKQVLQQNGYYLPKITVQTQKDAAGQQVNVTYTVTTGPIARVGEVALIGDDPGITEQQFRKKGKLKRKSKVNRETTSTALSNMRNFYQKKDRLEATTTLRKSTFDPAAKTLNYQFQTNQGPVVKVMVEGVKVSKSRLHLLVPVFEEGTVDNDLLNEGTHNIKDFLQQEGYFDAAVQVKVTGAGTPNVNVLYSVDKGIKHKVASVEIKGNKYFGTDLLKERLQVVKADAYQRSGRYSQSLVNSDESSMQSLYRANGFNDAKVTAAVKDVDQVKGKPAKEAMIRVVYTVNEGSQQTFGSVGFGGVEPQRQAVLTNLLNARQGQPFSLITLSGDRDAILSYYLSNGFDQARVEVKQTIEEQDKAKTDVAFDVTEGPQVFIGKVLLSGEIHVRPSVVNQQLRVAAADPLDQSALLETQRNLYNLAVFNEVIAAVQNPAGDAEQKNVLVQLTEAKRWDVTYGLGFEAQTGTPVKGVINPASAALLGISNSQTQEGKTGISERVSLDVSRILFRGKDENLSFHGTYGLLEEIATLSYLDPHFHNKKNFAFQISGGYSNVQNISTFSSSTLQGDVRMTEKAGRKDTFIYEMEYRRVSVQAGTLQVSANLIPQLSLPVVVGGPGLTWFHDTRRPSPLDATKGSYTSVQEFYASSKLGSQTEFNRVDATNATYYSFGGKHKYVFARNTRFGFINHFGTNPNAGTSPCSTNSPAGPSQGVNLLETNASCNPVPLPERLYAGGATSHRGFPINGAGPRDLQTGYPVGGSGAFVNSFELRLPAATLPYVGDSLSFVVFHDMGNVFYHIGDIFPSFGRFHQPNVQTCQVVTTAFGQCDFNYFSHAVGLGLRYKTPVGPIRADLSYNLNPPTYPVVLDFGNLPPYSTQASHFNFFFSIGQSF